MDRSYSLLGYQTGTNAFRQDEINYNETPVGPDQCYRQSSHVCTISSLRDIVSPIIHHRRARRPTPGFPGFFLFFFSITPVALPNQVYFDAFPKADSDWTKHPAKQAPGALYLRSIRRQGARRCSVVTVLKYELASSTRRPGTGLSQRMLTVFFFFAGPVDVTPCAGLLSTGTYRGVPVRACAYCLHDVHSLATGPSTGESGPSIR